MIFGSAARLDSTGIGNAPDFERFAVQNPAKPDAFRRADGSITKESSEVGLDSPLASLAADSQIALTILDKRPFTVNQS